MKARKISQLTEMRRFGIGMILHSSHGMHLPEPGQMRAASAFPHAG